ncbi:MAG TPA: hypothetical protein DEQ40_03280 [Oxalobacteraceae bacterium]|jgi:hypothetical protein|nr:hypothetical protein [Oxalobacteraceae bacterium]
MNTPAHSAMRAAAKAALVIVAGWAVYSAVDNAVEPGGSIAFQHFIASAASASVDNAAGEVEILQTAAAATPALLPLAASPKRAPGFFVLPQQLQQQIPQELYVGQLAAPPAQSAGAVSRSAPSTISNAATPLIAQPENAIPLLGPVMRESGRHAYVAPPFLSCTVEIREHGVLASHQTIGCSQSGDGERPSMLMEFGQEVPNEIPNMQYWLSVQVDGYRNGYPILRTRMELKGLLGRAVGRRKYESVTVVEPNRRHTVIAFNIDDDDFAVTVMANKQK